jgi:hypothetical protein
MENASSRSTASRVVATLGRNLNVNVLDRRTSARKKCNGLLHPDALAVTENNVPSADALNSTIAIVIDAAWLDEEGGRAAFASQVLRHHSKDTNRPVGIVRSDFADLAANSNEIGLVPETTVADAPADYMLVGSLNSYCIVSAG